MVMVKIMKIEMKPILNGETNSIVIDYEFMLPSEYLSADMKTDKPVKVEGDITAYSGYTELTLHVVMEYTIECARCLKPIKDALVLDFTKAVVSENTLESEDTDEYVIIEDGVVDVSVPIIDQTMMELPSKQLCDVACRGLCAKCGKDLNDGDCGCEIKEIDPRLAVLQQYLDKNEK